ncbi:MAG: HNH endonuclease [Candidatus Levybacteria bacterium]|nr:HNH endonuclease [Candidatus Levybacteria bacterium]
MNKIRDDIFSYREMCDVENATLQRGMNFHLNNSYSVILMSQRTNAPYKDNIHDDGVTIEYEGHDVSRSNAINPKYKDQPDKLPSGKLTQNGLFIQAVNEYKKRDRSPEIVKAYEKIMDGVWSLKGFFDLVDFKIVFESGRNVFRFILRLSENQQVDGRLIYKEILHTRLIPTEIKKEVWKRDQGKCVKCGETKNLHFDHDLPFSKGGTSLTAKNVRLLCVMHNLQKSDKIE